MGTIYVTHGVVSDYDPGRFVHKNMLDRGEFVKFLGRRREPFVALEKAIAGDGDSLTVDDGTRAASLAASLARELGHYVTIFVNPYQVETGNLYWFSLLDAALDNRTTSEILYAGETYPLASYEERSRFRRAVKRAVARIPDEDDRREHVEGIARALGACPVVPEWLDVFGVGELHELLGQGVGVENHGWTHADMGQLAYTSLCEQVTTAHDWLKRASGITTSTFAVPYGETVAPLAFFQDTGHLWLNLDERSPGGELRDWVYNRVELTPADIRGRAGCQSATS